MPQNKDEETESALERPTDFQPLGSRQKYLQLNWKLTFAGFLQFPPCSYLNTMKRYIEIK